ncbi:hypothetical protein C5167_006659 [Papaver somniferum]|uniref:Uncharacterized protein n=1 Tax=Papaver somniferum TaxID=3469 RepID=A0A4Y7JI67_PAPSO|nr:hypothetical protein C5167_006659 [Papaver somniferum]
MIVRKIVKDFPVAASSDVNKPELLPKYLRTIIDVAGFLLLARKVSCLSKFSPRPIIWEQGEIQCIKRRKLHRVICGRPPNFDLPEDEKQELRRYTWNEFLTITRSIIA